MYLILLVLGLCIGAVFLVVLLIGDKREARREAEKKALQEQITAAGTPVEGTWPPPPSAAALPDFSQPTPSTKMSLAPGTSRNMVRAFFRFRGYAAGTLVVAFIIYSAYPQLNFGWILLATATAFVALAAAITILKKKTMR